MYHILATGAHQIQIVAQYLASDFVFHLFIFYSTEILKIKILYISQHGFAYFPLVLSLFFHLDNSIAYTTIILKKKLQKTIKDIFQNFDH